MKDRSLELPFSTGGKKMNMCPSKYHTRKLLANIADNIQWYSFCVK